MPNIIKLMRTENVTETLSTCKQINQCLNTFVEQYSKHISIVENITFKLYDNVRSYNTTINHARWY